MGIVESYSGACGGARSCLAIDQARMWLLGKSCVSCLAGGQRTRFLAGILFGNIFRSLEQHCGVRAAPRSRFLANLVESAKHSCRRRGPPRSVAASVNGSRQPGPVQRKPKEKRTRNVRVVSKDFAKAQKARKNYPLASNFDCVGLRRPPQSAGQALLAHARRGGTCTAKTTLQPPQPCKKRCVPTAASRSRRANLI